MSNNPEQSSRVFKTETGRKLEGEYAIKYYRSNLTEFGQTEQSKQFQPREKQ